MHQSPHQPNMSQMQIRPAQESDLPQIRAINTHYILHTALTFAQTPPPPETYRARLTDLSARGLPYLVAVGEAASTNDHSQAGQVVFGYAYLSPFRGYLTAYAPTVELSLFLHPDYHSHGIGSGLLGEVLTRLTERKIRHKSDEIISGDLNDLPSHGPHITVNHIIAVMAVDPEGKDRGEALRRWYVQRGFQERGRLSGVGFKRGHWYVSCHASQPFHNLHQILLLTNLQD